MTKSIFFDPNDALDKAFDEVIPTVGLETEDEVTKADKELLKKQQGVSSVNQLVQRTEERMKVKEEVVKEQGNDGWRRYVKDVHLERRPRSFVTGPQNLVAEAHVTLTSGIIIRSLRVVSDVKSPLGIRVIHPVHDNFRNQKVKTVSLPAAYEKAVDEAVAFEFNSL